jgi:predicted amidohydrolase
VTPFRIALANLRFPTSPDDAVVLATGAVAEAGKRGARIICFPECFVPGYRGLGTKVPPPDPAFLKHAWSTIGVAAARARVAVVLGTERFVEGALRATVLVLGPDGVPLGFQDKVQIDPTEEGTYTPGTERRVFTVDSLAFGVVICHEGFRYPETVRFAARRGAKVVFHPHFDVSEPGKPEGYRPKTYGEPGNSFHEKAALCRAAENTCYYATVNCANDTSVTTSAVAAPDGSLLAYQPYGKEGLLVADLDLDLATGFLASRCRTTP